MRRKTVVRQPKHGIAYVDACDALANRTYAAGILGAQTKFLRTRRRVLRQHTERENHFSEIECRSAYRYLHFSVRRWTRRFLGEMKVAEFAVSAQSHRERCSRQRRRPRLAGVG